MVRREISACSDVSNVGCCCATRSKKAVLKVRRLPASLRCTVMPCLESGTVLADCPCACVVVVSVDELEEGPAAAYAVVDDAEAPVVADGGTPAVTLGGRLSVRRRASECQLMFCYRVEPLDDSPSLLLRGRGRGRRAASVEMVGCALS